MKRAYAQVYKLALGALPSMATRTACELGIPDILLAHEGTPLSASQICQHLQPPPAHAAAAPSVERLMRFLCAHGVFKAQHHEGDATVNSASAQRALYALSPVSRLLVKQAQGADVASGSAAGGTSCQTESLAMRQGATVTAVDAMDASGGNHTGSADTNTDDDTVNARADTPIEATVREFLLVMNRDEFLSPWQHLGQFILQGGKVPFFRAHGTDLWTFTDLHPEINDLFNAGMSCDAQLCMEILFKHYDGFKGVQSLVDVGGGNGMVASQIVSRYPSIKAVNFDLPQVIATAPILPGVQHIGGNMFEHVPQADAFFFKRVLHTFGDDECIKALQNCRKVLPKHGKVIIMDGVPDISAKDSNPFSDVRLALDVVMMVLTSAGKERTVKEWQCILEAANFHNLRFIDPPCAQCVIEACPAP